MENVIISIGSNLSPKENIEKAKELLQKDEKCQDWLFSGYYYSLPEGFSSNNPFINIVAYCKTSYTPQEFLNFIEGIEKELGRKEKSVNKAYKDRPIDIDIIFWGKKKLKLKNLIIPHPHWKHRHFVMNPLRELLSNHKFLKVYFDI